MDGWLCQRVNLYKDQKLASESVEILSWAITPPGWRSREFEQFWGFYGFGCMNYKTSHRFQGEDIADCLQSQIFDMRVKNEQLGWLVAWKSAVHRKPIAITRFAAHLTTSAKRMSKPPIWVGLYITYRTILNIGLYNRYLQRGLLKLSFSITIYLYRTIHYHAVMLLKNCTPISLYIHTCYIPIHMYLL